jgi:hypothetical protein
VERTESRKKMRHEYGVMVVREVFMAGIKKTVLAALLVIGLVMGLSSVSHATFTLTLDDLTTAGIDVTVVDNGAGDLDSRAGVIGYVGAAGSWDLNITGALTAPYEGTFSLPMMDLSTLSSGKGVLVMKASEIGYTIPAGSASIALDVGGTINSAGNSASFGVSVDSGNTLFGGSDLASLSFAPSLGGAFSGSTSAGFIAGSGPFSITETATLNNAVKGSTSFDFAVSVPEPFTLIFLGSCLLGAGMVSRKFKI